MIFILGHWLGHYNFPHSEVAVCLNAAKGFNAAEHPACVVWFGERKMHEGVLHIPVAEADPGENDIFLVMHPTIAAEVVKQDRLKHLLKVGRRWLYTNGAYGPAEAGKCIYNVEWREYTHIFVEAEQSVSAVRAQFPGKPVSLCWLGCQHDVDLESLTDPYPKGLKHLFFAGRLTHPDEMKDLMDILPPDYHLWIAARTFLVRDSKGSMVWKYIRGKEEPPQNQWSPTLEATELDHVQGVQLVDRIFEGDKRVHFLGSLPFGTFWDRHHFAFASLDIGLDFMPPTLNCKVFDAIRAGGRIITYGQSPSYFLIDKYQAGWVCPHMDYKKVRDILNTWQPEARELRFARALRFRDGESWHQRVKGMLRDGGAL